MIHFPNTLAAEMQPLPTDLGTDHANEALDFMEQNGYVVEAGLTGYLAGSIGYMATQEHIVEYCPNDRTASRFQSENSATKWVTKNGGRAMFGLAQVLDNDGRRWIGYGWTGAEQCPELPDCDTTFAIRLAKEATGKGLAIPFTTLILAGSASLYGARKIGLETWESNGAFKKYQEAGFVDRPEVARQDMRPTLKPAGSYLNSSIVRTIERNGKTFPAIDDTRHFMAYPESLLPPAPVTPLANSERLQLN